MTKHDLMEEVAQHFPHLSQQEVKAAVETVFAALTPALAAGKRIELRGVGSFGLKHHQARAGHNPRTGAAIGGRSANPWSMSPRRTGAESRDRVPSA